MKVQLQDIEKARERISSVIQKTPVDQLTGLSHLLGIQIVAKCENLQLTGSFKIRGALNKISQLSVDEKKDGVIAASAGNHAQGVALSSTKLDVKSTVVMPKNSSIVKQTATRNYGAKVILQGDYYDEAFNYARALAEKSQKTFIHPYEDPAIISGQGTLGLEVLEQVNDLDSIICPIGGGGLISGISVAIKSINPKIKIYGVVSGLAPGMYEMYNGLDRNAQVTQTSIADGISVKNPSPTMFNSFISKYVDDVVRIEEDDIAEAMVYLLERGKLLVEGSGAISLAAARKGGLNLGKKSLLVLSGGNVDLTLIGEILQRGLAQAGRVAHISVVVNDRPGTLSKLAKIIADSGANILNVEHNRTHASLHIRETLISFVLETKDFEHGSAIHDAFVAAGVRVLPNSGLHRNIES